MKTMSALSLKAQISGGKAAVIRQRVEDNTFHLRAKTKVISATSSTNFDERKSQRAASFLPLN